MAIEKETVSIEDALDTLRAEQSDRADEQAALPYDSDAANQLADEGQQYDRFIEGLLWFRNEYPECEELVLGRIDYGEQNLVNDLGNESESDRGIDMAWVAVSTFDAPYLAHDPPADGSKKTAVRQTAANVADLAPNFVQWVQYRIGNIDITGGEMGKSYQELVLERRIQATSTETSGGDTAESPRSQADTPKTS